MTGMLARPEVRGGALPPDLPASTYAALVRAANPDHQART
jgi:hypothetical protein